MDAAQTLNDSLTLAKATQEINKSVQVLRDAGQMLLDKSQEFANHANVMGTVEDVGHIKLGMGFERQPDGTVNINGTADFEDVVAAHKDTVTTIVEAFKTDVNTVVDTFKTEVSTTVNTFKTDIDAAEAAHKTDIETKVDAFKADVDAAEVAHKTAVDSTIATHKTDVTTYLSGAIPTQVATSVATHLNDVAAHPGISVANAAKWDGATRFVSSAAPAASMGANGDIYLQLV